jgi:hypothetical protein
MFMWFLMRMSVVVTGILCRRRFRATTGSAALVVVAIMMRVRVVMLMCVLGMTNHGTVRCTDSMFVAIAMQVRVVVLVIRILDTWPATAVWMGKINWADSNMFAATTSLARFCVSIFFGMVGSAALEGMIMCWAVSTGVAASFAR